MKRLVPLLIPLIIVAAIFLPSLWWGSCRIEVFNGEIAVLIKKTGRPLPPEQILATEPDQKGIQLEVLGEGRYFRNPFVWTWEKRKVTDIPAGSFGVLVRKFGKELPKGQIVAPSDDYKGVVREVLGTGKHRINPYAYEVAVFEDLRIMPGNVGVVTNLTGEDIFSGVPNDLENHKGFIVSPDRKGVLNEVLREGTHRLNPFVQSVSIVNIQSQRYEFSGEEAISFITMDGFNISLEGTVEFNILAEAAPCLTHEVGDMEDIMKKLIMPAVSGFARIEGSKKSATEFIVGESRQHFQNDLEAFLRKNCETWGISINSVLIRDIIPPQEIAEIIRNRELAGQEAKKFLQEIEQAKSAMELEQERQLALQRKEVVSAETRKITAEIAAKQAQTEKVVRAQGELEAASVEYQRAEAEAKAKLQLAEAERNVIAMQNRNDAEVLRQTVAAYGGGKAYLHGLLYSKLGPRIDGIVCQDAAGAFGLPLSAGQFEAAPPPDLPAPPPPDSTEEQPVVNEGGEE